MSIKSGLKSSFVRATAVMLLMALVGTGFGLADPSPVIERGYSTALTLANTRSTAVSGIPDAGSEAYWLSRDLGGLSSEQNVEPVMFRSPLAKGERLLVERGSQAQIGEVVNVEVVPVAQSPAAATRIDLSAPARRMAVTCRLADGSTFRFELEMAAPESELAATAHAL